MLSLTLHKATHRNSRSFRQFCDLNQPTINGQHQLQPLKSPVIEKPKKLLLEMTVVADLVNIYTPRSSCPTESKYYYSDVPPLHAMLQKVAMALVSWVSHLLLPTV